MNGRVEAALTLRRPFSRGILLISDSLSADLPTYTGTAVVASDSAVVVRVRRPSEDDPGESRSEVTVVVRLGLAAGREPLFDGVIEVDSGRISVGDTDADEIIEVTPGRWRVQVLPDATEQAGSVEVWVSLPPESPLASAFLRFAPTVRGQLTGVALIAGPVIVAPLPLGSNLHGVVQVAAVLLGCFGAALVFGGLLQRLLIQAAGPALGPGGRPRTVPLDDLLRTVPYPLVVWSGVGVIAASVALGAVWSLVFVLLEGWTEHLADTMILALPATALGWLASRGFRSHRPTMTAESVSH